MFDLEFFKGKKVFITGHTGFKGSWLCKALVNLGAEVTGYTRCPVCNSKLFMLTGVANDVNSVIGDVRDYETMKSAFDEACPDIVIHMAAQPLVLESYKRPRYTFETNVLGTVNILECVRTSNCVKSFLNVTTDRVYLNRGMKNLFEEAEPLDGFDPYSNSKSCSDLVTHSYKNSFFMNNNVAISISRAGNVIAGGDLSENRIIPDCVRAALKGETIIVRNPHSIRPYQHVLDPLFAYLSIIAKQYDNVALSGWYNVSPDECDCVTTGKLVDLFCKAWGNGLVWKNVAANAPHEADFLKLDNSKVKRAIGWQPVWHIDEAVRKTVEWTKVWKNGGDVSKEMDREIDVYLKNRK